MSKILSLLAAIVALASPIPAGSAQELAGDSPGGLLVAPTRVVFEDRVRGAELTLLNTGSTPATYRITFVRMRMHEDGSFQEIDEPLPGEQFADALVRYSPREITLEPNDPQTIRLQVRKPAELPSGEYRSHLLLRAVPAPESTGRSIEEPDGPAAGIQIRLAPLYGVSVPVIVRHGDTRAEASLTELQLRADGAVQPGLALTMGRTGNRSIFGDLRVLLVGPGGEERLVGEMKGIAVYAPNPLRRVVIPLEVSPAELARGRALRAVYSAQSPSGEVLARAEIPLP